MHLFRFAVLLTIAGALTPPRAGSAQDVLPGGSILQLLPTNGRTVQVDGEAQGTLTDWDLVSTSGHRLQAWELRAPIGAQVTVDVTSTELDAILYVLDPGAREPLEDDDSGGACNPRITFSVTGSGAYRVVVGSLGAENGSFTLAASTDPAPATLGDCVGPDVALPELPRMTGHDLAAPAEHRGELTTADYRHNDGRHMQSWTVSGKAGQTFVADLVSMDFDAQLYLRGPGISTHLSDDDGAGNCNARISLAFPETGEYELVVTSLSADATGSFTIIVGEEPGPTRSGSCGFGSEEGFVASLLSLSPGDRTVERGAEVTGTLTSDDVVDFDGAPAQAWRIQADAGGPVTVDLVSGDFDAMLYVVSSDLDTLLEDDDGAGNCNARITFTPRVGTEYLAVVRSYGEGGEGAFTLIVSDQPGPVRPGACEAF